MLAKAKAKVKSSQTTNYKPQPTASALTLSQLDGLLVTRFQVAQALSICGLSQVLTGADGYVNI